MLEKCIVHFKNEISHKFGKASLHSRQTKICDILKIGIILVILQVKPYLLLPKP